MLAVTGGAGFIGGRLIRALSAHGHEVVAVDAQIDGPVRSLNGIAVVDLINKDRFLELLARRDPAVQELEIVLHQGAITNTLDRDSRRVFGANYDYSKRLLSLCQMRGVRLIYASSAAVYGASPACQESEEYEHPVNVYGRSKLLFDQFVRTQLPTAGTQIVGLRYFNVYGRGEEHKGAMASLVWQLHRQLLATGRVTIFGASHGYGPGEQRRDFVSVEDVVATNEFFLTNATTSGIFNVGTGQSWTFNQLAREVIAFHGYGELEYIPFPRELTASYQPSTRADISALRHVGCAIDFTPIEMGIPRYLTEITAPTHESSTPTCRLGGDSYSSSDKDSG